MVFETRSIKKSQFTGGSVDDNIQLDFVKNGVNQKAPWGDFLAHIADVYGASLRTFEFESELVASDIALGEYAIVEENQYAFYKIGSLAANPGDVTLNSGFVATMQTLFSRTFSTTAVMQASKSNKEGDIVTTREFADGTGTASAAAYKVVLTSSIVPNVYDKLETTVVGGLLSYVLVFDDELDIRKIGAVAGTTVDTLAVLQHANSIASVITGGFETYAVLGTLQLSSFKKLTNIKLKLLGDQSDYTISAIINDGRLGNGNLGIIIDNVEIIGFNTVQQNLSTPITPANGGVGGIYLEKISDTTVKDCSIADTWSGIVFTFPHVSTLFTEANNKCINNKILRAHSWASTGNSGTPRGVFFGVGGDCKGNYSQDCATGYYLVGDAITASYNVAKDWYIDDGYYILGRDFIVTENRAIGFIGNGYAIAYNEESIISDNYASGCTNMGFRVHCPQRDTIITGNRAESCGYGFRIENSIDMSAASLTSSGTTATFTSTINNILTSGDFVVVTGVDQPEYNGIFRVTVLAANQFSYTMLSAPGVSPATGSIIAQYTSQGLNISNNQASYNNNSGIQLSFLVNSIINENHCISNNVTGATISTRGGLSFSAYCNDNTAKDNKCYDYGDVPTQVFGFYMYDASTSGAIVENQGNSISHKSDTGIDYFGAVEFANPRSEIEAGEFTPTIEGSTTAGTVGYSLQRGRYYRQGNLVTTHIQLQLSSVSGMTGIAQIKGLPFVASAGVVQPTGTLYSHAVTYNVGFDNMVPVVSSNSDTINLVMFASGSNSSNLDAAGVTSATQIYITLSYWIKN